MRWRAALIAVVLMVVSAAVLFRFFQRQLSEASFAFGSYPEVLDHLEGSLEDLKLIAELDPENETVYRQRFGKLETTVQRLHILEHTRDDLADRYDTVLLTLFALIMVLVTGVYAWRQTRHAPRLERLRTALGDLAEGSSEVEIDDRGVDTIGRIAQMIESTSRVVSRDRRRLSALRNLSAWQEAARRHAHEMRTPLTAARLQLTRIRDLLDQPENDVAALQETLSGTLREIDRLAHFTKDLTSFARLPRPNMQPWDADEIVQEFVETYASAWPNLEITTTPPHPSCRSLRISVDKEMIGQVLFNLCDNSSRACSDRTVRIEFRTATAPGEVVIDATDNGPGVPDSMRSTIFEPYTTTRPLGEGMGLGLALCRKILLDHSGDLLLRDSPQSGATFRLIFPTVNEASATT